MATARRSNERKLTDAKIASMRKQLKAGATVEQLARKHRLTDMTIYRWVVWPAKRRNASFAANNARQAKAARAAKRKAQSRKARRAAS